MECKECDSYIEGELCKSCHAGKNMIHFDTSRDMILVVIERLKLGITKSELLQHFIENPFEVFTLTQLEELPCWKDTVNVPSEEGGKAVAMAIYHINKHFPGLLINIPNKGYQLNTAKYEVTK